MSCLTREGLIKMTGYTWCIFVIFAKGDNLWTSSGFPTVDSKAAIPLLQFLFLCASAVSYVAFNLSSFVPHLSFFWWLEKTAS